MPSTLKRSTAKEAHTVPWRVARRRVRSSTEPDSARCPRKPPAKLSPAPVGSVISSNGKAGDQKEKERVKSTEPYSPRLTTTARDRKSTRLNSSHLVISYAV